MYECMYNLLHDLVFTLECGVFERLGVCSCTDKLLIGFSLLVTTSFTQLPICVDLIGQVSVKEIFLGFLGLKIDSNLIKSLFRSEVRLIV